MTIYDVHLVFTDGTKQTIEYANSVKPFDGVLFIRFNKDDGPAEDLGSFPLVNLRSWKTVPR
jgi:hypothetical protein